MLAAVVGLMLAGAPTQAQVRRAIAEDFERVGRTTPADEPGLDRAAQEVAERALRSGVEEAASLLRVTAAVSRHGGWDPSPIAVVIRGRVDELIASLHKNGLADEPASLAGVGLASDEERGALAVLLARRRVDLAAFPRTLRGASAALYPLCGVLKDPLTSAEAFVTRPDGAVERVDMAPSKGRLCTQLSFPTTGRHTVEVLGRGPRGPEVAALFFVDVGQVRSGEDEAVALGPQSDVDARAQLLVRINALRLRMGASPVQPDPALDAVAQAWARRLADENFFSHIAPDGSDLKRRLTEAGYRFTAAGENLGLSSGPLAAHFGIEHSPGHRRNLLEKEHQRLGVGLATRADGLTVLVEVLALPAQAARAPLKDPVGVAYKALADERARKRLPSLAVSPTLEAIAQQHALAALEAQLPKAALPGKRKLHDQVFETMDEVKSVAVDVFVSDNPALIVDSKNLANPRATTVGVGLVQGDSAQYGDGRYWIVVVYAGPT